MFEAQRAIDLDPSQEASNFIQLCSNPIDGLKKRWGNNKLGVPFFRVRSDTLMCFSQHLPWIIRDGSMVYDPFLVILGMQPYSFFVGLPHYTPPSNMNTIPRSGFGKGGCSMLRRSNMTPLNGFCGVLYCCITSVAIKLLQAFLGIGKIMQPPIFGHSPKSKSGIFWTILGILFGEPFLDSTIFQLLLEPAPEPPNKPEVWARTSAAPPKGVSWRSFHDL